MFVPVLNQKQEPLMPTTQWRASKWISSGKATGFWKKGVFCVRLNQKPSSEVKQEIVVGIDPGSKREAFTVKSKSHTYLNILTETPDWVKDAIEARRNARRARRNRNTPCRKNRINRSKSPFPPSTKARWQWKIRVLNWLNKMFPITQTVVEDIKAKTKGKKKWDKMFSPLEVGKNWFYQQIPNLTTFQGYETKQFRDELGLKKSQSKLADKFECHNIDSWVLANKIIGGHEVPDNKVLLKIIPLQYHRRQLHMFQSTKGDIRKNYGSTRSLGFSRGSIVKHKKFGVTYVGGSSEGRISLHNLKDGKRLCQNAKIEDVQFLTYGSWRGNSSQD
jgi:hypothetical protein